jgi:N-acetylneuraminic acid mutarotase
MLRAMERYDALSNQWDVVASMSIERAQFSACVYEGGLFVIGGYYVDDGYRRSYCVEKYSPTSDTWCVVAPLPAGRVDHATVVVGSAMFVLGGETDEGVTASVLKFNSAEGTWSEICTHARAARNVCVLRLQERYLRLWWLR